MKMKQPGGRCKMKSRGLVKALTKDEINTSHISWNTYLDICSSLGIKPNAGKAPRQLLVLAPYLNMSVTIANIQENGFDG